MPAIDTTTAATTKPRVTTTGTIRWWAAEYGHGFIACPEGDEFFFRFSDLDAHPPALTPGTIVTFVPSRDARGSRARNVQA